MVKTATGILGRAADWLDRWHLTRIMSALSSFAIILAVVSFVVDLQDRSSERILRAWQVATETSGPAPKEAIRYLIQNGQSLRGARFESGADLSDMDFRSMDLERTSFTGSILDRVKFSKANLRAGSFRKAAIRNSKFDETDLSEVDFEGAFIADSDFSNAHLKGAYLRRSDIVVSDFSNTDLSFADLTASSLVIVNLDGADVTRAVFESANVSGTSFLTTHGVDSASFEFAWFWKDYPPIGLDERAGEIRACHPVSTSTPLAERPLIRPDGISCYFYDLER